MVQWVCPKCGIKHKYRSSHSKKNCVCFECCNVYKNVAPNEIEHLRKEIMDDEHDAFRSKI